MISSYALCTMMRALYEKIKTDAGFILASLVACMFLGFKLYRTELQWSDEPIHLYMVRQMLQGHILYGDLHSARPPLDLLPLYLCLKLGLSDVQTIVVSMSMIWIATLASVARLGYHFAGFRAACCCIISTALMPVAFQWGTYTGIHAVGLAVLLSVTCLILEKYKTASVIAGLAIMTGQHSAIILSVLALYVIFKYPKQALQMALISIGTASSVVLYFYALGGHSIVHDLFLKHLYHFAPNAAYIPASIQRWIIIILLDHTPWIFYAVLYLWFVSKSSNTWPRVIAVASVMHWLFVANMHGAQILYVYPAMPLIALLAGLGFDASLKQWSVLKQLKAVSIVTCTTLMAWYISAKRYEEQESLHVFRVPHARWFLSDKNSRFIVRHTVAEYLQTILTPEQTIFGESVPTTAVALAANVRVAAQLADLPTRLYHLKEIDRFETIRAIEQDHVGAIITPRWFYTKDAVFKAYLEQCYLPEPHVIRRKKGTGLPELLVYQHQSNRPMCEPVLLPVTGRTTTPEITTSP